MWVLGGERLLDVVTLLRRRRSSVLAVAVTAACLSAVLPTPPSWADASVRISAPQYEAPGGTVPVIVTMYGVPSGTTSVVVSARGTNGSTATCAGEVWINRGRGTASRTCYLTLPRTTGSFNVVGTATAQRSGLGPVTRSGTSGRAVLANGPVSGGTQSLATMRSIERCQNPGPAVWLTFDDGASSTQLSNILATLSRNNVRGHFFFTGAWRDQNPSLYRRLLDSGHEVANHSDNHPALSKLGDAAVSSQISRGVSASTSPKLIRPPFGAGSFTARLQSLAGAQSYRVCRWTVDTYDWDSASPALMKERVVTGDYRSPPVAAGGVILMHGTGRHTSVGGLQAVIDGVRARRLTLMPLRGAPPGPAAKPPTVAPTPPPPAPLPAPAVCQRPADSATSTTDTPRVSISATARQVPIGVQTTVYGYVADADGCAVVGATVALRYQPYEKPVVVLQELTTDSSGRYSRAVAPPREARFTASVQNVTSGTYVLAVSRRITGRSPAAGSRPQNPVLFEGQISPAQPGLQVGFARWDTDRWVYIGQAQSDGVGSYAVRLRLPSGGLTVRTYTSASGGNTYGEQVVRIVVPA